MSLLSRDSDDLRRFKHDLSSPITVLNCLLQDLKISFDLDIISSSLQATIDLLLQAMYEINAQFQLRHDPELYLHKSTFSLNNFLRQFNSFSTCPYPVRVRVYSSDLKNKKIYGNQLQLKNAINHLISNACEAYVESLALKEVKIYAHPVPTGTIIMVSDLGQGMNWWQKCVVRFKGISFKVVKSGLGLWEARRIIQSEYGGWIRIFSRHHFGTALCIFLPV